MTDDNQFSSPVNILPVGSFGMAVSRYLRSSLPLATETVTPPGELPPEQTCLRARINVVAAWRPVLPLCDFIDRLSHQHKKPFFSVILDGTALRLGPIVVPGRGSCWDCWVRRSRQHATWPKEQAAVWQHYAAHPDAGPKGYLEPLALLAAARSRHIVAGLNSSNVVPGAFWEIDTITRQITTSVVVGVHDCPRCGLHRSNAEITVAEMQRHLTYLWARCSEQEDRSE